MTQVIAPVSAPTLRALAGMLATAALTQVADLRAQAVSQLPLRRGEIVVEIRATRVNDFEARVPVQRATFTGSDINTVIGRVEVRVADMRTGIGLRDRHLRGAMEADTFPTIRFDLVGVIPEGHRGDTLVVAFQGQLTIHGLTKAIRVPGTVLIRPNEIHVTSRFTVDMREYGIRPPSRFLGTVQVQPDVAINVRLEFAQQ